MTQRDCYQSPLTSRYASKEMSALFSEKTRAVTWRKVWVALARAEMELGLPITKEQVDELEASSDQVNFDEAGRFEKELRHDVMAHIHAYGKQCPKASSIIHLGATSCTITDNGDLLIYRQALQLITHKLVQVIKQLATFSEEQRSLPTLAFTHYQPAQLTTVGKRACLWLQDLLIDLKEVETRCDRLPFLGIKGTTGTQASFLSLFDGDHQKVQQLEARVAELLGFKSIWPVSGQTYPRKLDALIVDTLSGVGATAHKFGSDLRLLANLKEMEEPYEAKQVGSSAMPYKRNPMRSERLCSLSRFLISLSESPKYTAATQWFERTLDDSANRRLVMSEAFLSADAALNLLINITSGLIIYPKAIDRHVREELPFIATENLLMHAVKQGGDRQALHEKLRQYSWEAKEKGQPDHLLEAIVADPDFSLDKESVADLLHPANFVGRAPEQVLDFLKGPVAEVFNAHKDAPSQAFVPQV